MHSAYETGGVRDVMYAIRAPTAFYERNLTINGAERCGAVKCEPKK